MLVPTLILLVFLNFACGQRCISRDFGNGGTVCVCNATYCDTISRPQRSDSVLIYTSNQNGSRFEQSSTTFEPRPNTTEPRKDRRPQILVNERVEFQQINGFGGAFTDAAGLNILLLPEGAQDALLRSYYSEEGIEYTLGRVPIGGTDFSTRAYSYDDGPFDPFLENFALQPEDFNYKIPLIKRARNLTNNTLRLVCSAWTAPKWLKTNGEYAGFGFIRPHFYETWAEYHLRFLEAYQGQNISFWALTTGNEPADIYNPFDVLEVVGWPSWLIGDYISNYLGPTIRNSSQADINILILDDQRAFVPWYINRAFRGNNAESYVDGIAVHWYLDEFIPPDVLSKTHKEYPNKFLLATEACNMPTGEEGPVELGSWYRGEKYTEDIIADLSNWVTGWIDWNIALNPEGGPNYIKNFVDSPIIVNASSGEFYKQPMYYHLGHFSKFIPPGSVRIHSVQKRIKHVESIAFKRPDNGKVLVLLNKNEEGVSLNINDRQRGTTSVELTGRSITTVLYW